MIESTKASLLGEPAVVERAHPPVAPQIHGPFRCRRDEMSELNRLRCRLRAVNIEYSALVRRKVGEAAYARMRELRTERRMLMALIAVVRHAAEMDVNAGEKMHRRAGEKMHRRW